MAITPGYQPHEYTRNPASVNVPQIPSAQQRTHNGTSNNGTSNNGTSNNGTSNNGTSNNGTSNNGTPNNVPSNNVPQSSQQTMNNTNTTSDSDYLDRTASSVSNDDTLQDNVLHDKSGKSIRNSNVPKVRKKVSKDTIQIRDFPRDVMDIIRGVVPGGNSYVETLLAYIYVTCPTKFDISPNIQAIVEDYMQEDQLTQVFREIRLLREQIRNVEMTTYQSALASEYSLLNNLGLRNDKATNPSDINYLESGIEDMHIALEESAKQLKKKDTIRHGRK